MSSSSQISLSWQNFLLIWTPLPKRKQAEQKRVKWKKQEDSVDCKHSVSSSESGSSSSQSDKVEKEVCKKRKWAGQDADGNVTWTEESVSFLFETYKSIHRQLWQESNGQVKYQKKWTAILKAMHERFGYHFSKKQCQSKYWSVQRECSDYRLVSISQNWYQCMEIWSKETVLPANMKEKET